MIDPQTARRVFEEYHATATDQEIIDDLRRYSPGLAQRLGVGLSGPVPRMARKKGVLRIFEAFGRTLSKPLS
jgi:hypothetical protein